MNISTGTLRVIEIALEQRQRKDEIRNGMRHSVKYYLSKKVRCQSNEINVWLYIH